MARSTEDKLSTQELLQAQLQLWHHTFGYVKSMALKCAVDLRIPDAIHHYGGAATLPELLSKLALHPSKLPHLRRLMRVLTDSGVFAVRQPAPEDSEAVYALTSASRLLAGDKASSSQSPFICAMMDPILAVPFFSMSTWFADERQTSLFEMTHGDALWEVAARDNEHNMKFNDGLVADTRLVMEIALRESSDVFLGINSLVDVAGGEGAAATAIVNAFPHMKCSVLDLPHVVSHAPACGNVQFVAGDMFEHVPPADAVFLKNVLHDWSDEECVKILQRCKEAIPPRDIGGKVIIIDIVVGSKPEDITSKEMQVLFDLFIMFIGGVERDELQWKKIFVEAGFNNYKIIPVLGFRSIIELYP